MRAAALVFVTACWTVTASPPVAPVEPPAVIVDSSPNGFSGPIARSRPSYPLHSVWEGTYVCSQGLSYVKMTIDAQRDGTAGARYDFGATAINPTVPTGAYTMKGTIHATPHGFTVELEPDEWIDHPPGYVMVALSLEATGREMTGTIQHTSCNGFQARRID